MQHIILVGACYLDTILSVPHYPEEDSKLRATSLHVRRGGNCPNSLEVLHRLLAASRKTQHATGLDDTNEAGGGQFQPSKGCDDHVVQTHLVSPLPARDSAATRQILSSFILQSDQSKQEQTGEPAVWGQEDTPSTGGEESEELNNPDFDHCLYRENHFAPASSYVFRSAAGGSRTVVNYNELPDMSLQEFADVIASLTGDRLRQPAVPSPHTAPDQRGHVLGDDVDDAEKQDQKQHDADSTSPSLWWWHFEGRNPETTLACLHMLRSAYNDQRRDSLRISVELEKPGREGLRELADEADIVFYSRSWAEGCGYSSAEDCLRGESLRRASLAFCTWGSDGAACLSLDDTRYYHCSPDRKDITVVDAVGAGDTFIAGILFGLTRSSSPWDIESVLRFAVDLATLKVQREGFGNLASS